MLVACGGAPLSASLHEAMTPGQRTWTGRCFLPQHATCMQPSVCSVSQLASRGALCMQCRFRGYLHMQCSSHGALAMHSFQSICHLAGHFACSAASASICQLCSSLSRCTLHAVPLSRVPSHAVQLSRGTCHAVQLSRGTCHAQPLEHILCMQCRFRGYLHMQSSSLRARAMNSHSF